MKWYGLFRNGKLWKVDNFYHCPNIFDFAVPFRSDETTYEIKDLEITVKNP